MALPQNFEEEVMALKDEEIKDRVSQYILASMEHKERMDADDELEKLRLAYKDKRDDYAVPIKEIKEKLAVCKAVLDARGKGVTV